LLSALLGAKKKFVLKKAAWKPMSKNATVRGMPSGQCEKKSNLCTGSPNSFELIWDNRVK